MSEDESPYDPLPGRYCCLSPDCDHDREQIFHGGGDTDA